MTKLTFHGPFHFDDIDSRTGKIKKERNVQNVQSPNESGVYIWGFMYDYDQKSKSLGKEPINFNDIKIKKEYNKETMQFIPYYVGEHENNMFVKRLFRHHNVRSIGFQSDAEKYTRLSFDYMRKFFKNENPENEENPNFPIHFRRSKIYPKQIVNLIKKDQSKIVYFNNDSALTSIYPGSQPVNVGNSKRNVENNKRYNYRIKEQDFIKESKDTLYETVNNKNNFWFCYSLETFKKYEPMDCEAFTFFSLKGKTISETKKLLKIDLKIIDKTETSIFKSEPSDYFEDGYNK